MSLTRFCMVESTMSFLRRRRLRFELFSCMQWFKPPLLRRTLPLPVILNRFFAARFDFIFGMMPSARPASEATWLVAPTIDATHGRSFRGVRNQAVVAPRENAGARVMKEPTPRVKSSPVDAEGWEELTGTA